MIIYSHTGEIFDSTQSGLMLYTDEPGRAAVVRGQNYYTGTFYRDIAGVIALRSGDRETAAKYAMTRADLEGMQWAQRYEGSTGRRQSEERNQQRREAAALEEAELLRKLEKSGTLQQWEYDHRSKPAYSANSAESVNLDNKLLTHILPRIREAGYHLEDYDESHPNAKYKLINTVTGETDDAGICAGNRGIWCLFDLAELFGDPCARDPLRCVKDPNTGEVLGLSPTFDPAKTRPTRKLTDTRAAGPAD